MRGRRILYLKVLMARHKHCDTCGAGSGFTKRGGPGPWPGLGLDSMLLDVHASERGPSSRVVFSGFSRACSSDEGLTETTEVISDASTLRTAPGLLCHSMLKLCVYMSTFFYIVHYKLDMDLFVILHPRRLQFSHGASDVASAPE